MNVAEAVIISLPERSERRTQLLASLPADWPFPRPQVVPGVRATRPPWFLSSDGAYGCQQAHLNVLRSAWERAVPTTLVLEDDAVFCPDFTARWQKIAAHIPPTAAMLMLGGQHIDRPRTHGFSLVRCTNTRRTHAYIITLKAIPFLIRTWAATRRHIDHALADFQANTGVYAPAEFMIGQSAGESDISRKLNPHTRFWI